MNVKWVDLTSLNKMKLAIKIIIICKVVDEPDRWSKDNNKCEVIE